MDTQTHYQSVDTQTHYQSVDIQTHYQSVLLLLNTIVLNREAADVNFIDFRSTRSGLQHTIYLTSGAHNNYYITDAVLKICKELKTQNG